MGILMLCGPRVSHAQDALDAWLDAESFGRQLERSQDRKSNTHKAEAGEALNLLSYTPSDVVSAQVNGSMADLLTGRRGSRLTRAARVFEPTFSDNPRFRGLLARQLGGSRDEILRGLSSGALQARFQQMLVPFGYSARNFGDVNNAFLVYGWSLVNETPVDYPQAFAALREKLNRALANGRPPPFSGEQMQDDTESITLLIMLAYAAWHDANRHEDKLAIQAGVSDIGGRMGVDFRGMVLTSHGFEHRR